MSSELIDIQPHRVGLYRHNQFRNEHEEDHHDLWPEILRAYRRYRRMGIARAHANLLTIGYADGRRPGPVISTMRPDVQKDLADYD